MCHIARKLTRWNNESATEQGEATLMCCNSELFKSLFGLDRFDNIVKYCAYWRLVFVEPIKIKYIEDVSLRLHTVHTYIVMQTCSHINTKLSFAVGGFPMV